MLKFTTGNIIKCETEAIVNSVNTQGIMGKGIALAFKNAYPDNFKIYEKACKEGTIDIGKLLITETGELFPKYIINFPTKKHWRNPSKYEYIEKGLKDLKKLIREYKIQSISIPPLGAGNGRLKWQIIKEMIIDSLKEFSNNLEILIFEPGYNDQNIPEEKQIELTPARALFVYLLKNYQILGYQINLLVAQKIAYFMQRFGENLRLNYEKGTYGPYSNNLNHLLKLINNAYIRYNQNDNSPMTNVEIISEKYPQVFEYYHSNISEEQKERATKLLKFIEDFESPYGLELLATIDFISTETGKKDISEIENEISHWTTRKREIMKPKHIQLAYERLREYNLI